MAGFDITGINKARTEMESKKLQKKKESEAIKRTWPREPRPKGDVPSIIPKEQPKSLETISPVGMITGDTSVTGGMQRPTGRGGNLAMPTLPPAAQGIRALPQATLPPDGQVREAIAMAKPYKTDYAVNMPEPLSIVPRQPSALAKIGTGVKSGITGIGKWAEDPNISKALMQAGLSILATPPRQVPYSNAEMLGKAGLTGIATYDEEIAKKAAKAEMARKAGIEERGVGVAEGTLAIAKDKARIENELVQWQKAHPEAKMESNIATVGGKTGYPVVDKYGKVLGIIPASEEVLGALTKKGGEKDSEQYFKASRQLFDINKILATSQIVDPDTMMASPLKPEDKLELERQKKALIRDYPGIVEGELPREAEYLKYRPGAK